MKKIFKLKDEKIKAHYYKDGSGEIIINIPTDGWSKFFINSGTINNHIETIQNKIFQYEKDLPVLKRALKILKKNVKNLDTLDECE